jgi:hypothetical protein
MHTHAMHVKVQSAQNPIVCQPADDLPGMNPIREHAAQTKHKGDASSLKVKVTQMLGSIRTDAQTS